MDHKPPPVVRKIPFPTGTPDALPVVTRERAADLVSMPWTLARIEDNGRRPIIVSQRRHLHVGVTIEVTDQAVTIALLAEQSVSTGRAHTQARIHCAYSVILDQPLQGRELRHAAVTYEAHPVVKPSSRQEPPS
jgi:hypothetical protein